MQPNNADDGAWRAELRERGWATYDEAERYTGKARKTLEPKVREGLVGKRLVSRPGKKDQPQLAVADLDKLVNDIRIAAPVSDPIPSDGNGATTRSDLIRSDHARGLKFYPDAFALTAPRLKPDQTRAFLDALAGANAAAAAQPRSVDIEDKLTWSLKEARAMTGLPESALRKLMDEDVGHGSDALIFHHGRRRFFKAAKLRARLS